MGRLRMSIPARLNPGRVDIKQLVIRLGTRPAQLRRRREWPLGTGVKTGFTLIEALVITLIIGVLVTLVSPVVMRGFRAAEYVRIVHDLDATRRAVTMFNLNLRNTFPDKVKHLVDPIAPGDLQFNQEPYSATHIARWKGPYLIALPDPATEVVRTRLGIEITAFLAWFNSKDNVELLSFSEAVNWVAIKTSEMTSVDFEELNNLIDGEGEPDGALAGQSQTIGKLRLVPSFPPVVPGDVLSGNVFYLAAPYRH